MRPSVLEHIPDPDTFLEMEPEDAAGHLIAYFNLPYKNPSPQDYLNRTRFIRSLFSPDLEVPAKYRGLARSEQERIEEALMEAWWWLEREGLIVNKSALNQGEYFVSRRGKMLHDPESLKKLRRADLLPRKILHPTIGSKIQALYLRGDYDIAVLQALKEVEVAVRQKSGLPVTLYGVALMHQAFNSKKGELTDFSLIEPEREAMRNLFAGAIGAYKNPQSHRNVPTTAEDAVELIMLANRLLRIVDTSTKNP